jgi:hypothetical protein
VLPVARECVNPGDNAVFAADARALWRTAAQIYRLQKNPDMNDTHKLRK